MVLSHVENYLGNGASNFIHVLSNTGVSIDHCIYLFVCICFCPLKHWGEHCIYLFVLFCLCPLKYWGEHCICLFFVFVFVLSNTGVVTVFIWIYLLFIFLSNSRKSWNLQNIFFVCLLNSNPHLLEDQG